MTPPEANFRVRQPTFLFCRFDEKEFVDVAAMLRGTARLSARSRILAVSLLTEKEVEICRQDLEILASIPRSAWITTPELQEKIATESRRLLQLASDGVLITDYPAEPFTKLREMDRLLAATNWSPYAALHHFMSKWTDRNLVTNTTDGHPESSLHSGNQRMSLDDTIRIRGLPPPHFYSRPDATEITDLPLETQPGNLYQVLTQRRTTRSFDASRYLPLAALSQLLYYTFGCHGLASLTSNEEYAGQLVGIKKTSPSGGALTPVECYPLLTRVQGLDAGLFHYNVERHTLERLKITTVAEAESLAESFTAGQSYYRDAHALFIMTARFYRQFWKYDQHEKAYRVLLMDAAHLSQTMYLVCTEMKLGAFVTAAVNETRIEQALGLNAQEEGVLCIGGCGLASPDSDREIALKPLSYDPGKARSG